VASPKKTALTAIMNFANKQLGEGFDPAKRDTLKTLGKGAALAGLAGSGGAKLLGSVVQEFPNASKVLDTLTQTQLEGRTGMVPGTAFDVLTEYAPEVMKRLEKMNPGPQAEDEAWELLKLRSPKGGEIDDRIDVDSESAFGNMEEYTQYLEFLTKRAKESSDPKYQGELERFLKEMNFEPRTVYEQYIPETELSYFDEILREAELAKKTHD